MIPTCCQLSLVQSAEYRLCCGRQIVKPVTAFAKAAGLVVQQLQINSKWTEQQSQKPAP